MANKVYSPKLKQDIFWHVAIQPNIITIGDIFYLELYPTFIITSDGVHPLEGAKQGAVITTLQYNKYNDQYLNNILFWANKLSEGNDEIKICPDLIISADPISTTIDHGIRWDIPTYEVKSFIENYDKEHAEEEYIVDDDHEETELDF